MALYTYDQRGRPETRVNFSNRVHTTFRHDLNGRLCESIKKGDDGVVHVTSSEYDPFDRKIHSKDSYNNSTTHSYDPIVNQITQTTFPSIASVNHEPKEVTTSATYDPLNRLIEVTSGTQKVNFIYDPLGRRVSQIVYTPTPLGWKESSRENYLYHGQNEIGAFTTYNTPKNLRVLGLAQQTLSPTTIAIELDGRFFAPIIDVQGNIRRLIDLDTTNIAESYDFTAFGEDLHPNAANTLNPWRFASKRFYSEIGLIDFGKRYYDPELARWLTLDPAGSLDSANLYQYIFNNPFRYRDPDGQFVFAIPLVVWGAQIVLPAVSAYVAPIIYGALTGAVLYGAHTIYENYQSQGYPSSSSLNMSWSTSLLRFDVKPVRSTMPKKQIDERLPDSPSELLNDPDWKETSHPKAEQKGHRTFENKKTGETIRYDAGKPGTMRHKAQDHWHRHNPDSTGDINKYLDAKGNPIPDGHPDSHLYPRQEVNI